MRPDYHEAIIDTIRHYGWEKIIYLYDSHDGKCSNCSAFVLIDWRKFWIRIAVKLLKFRKLLNIQIFQRTNISFELETKYITFRCDRMFGGTASFFTKRKYIRYLFHDDNMMCIFNERWSTLQFANAQLLVFSSDNFCSVPVLIYLLSV